MRDEIISEFLKELGSKTPTPGGGTVAGLNGAIAASQLKMVCEYSKNEKFKTISENLVGKIDQFLDLAKKDSQVYLALQVAFKTKDKAKIDEALIAAAEPSFEILTLCNELIKISNENINEYNDSLLADLIVALANVKSAIRSSQAMLSINVKSMKNEGSRVTVKEKILYSSQLLQKVDDQYKQIWSLMKNG